MQVSGAVACLIILTGAGNFKGTFSQESCESPQYLSFGEPGTLNCFFPHDFFSVLWYNTTDYSHHAPILHYQNLEKTGSGYETGEYDIHPNGSLIINNVSLQHEKEFTVAYIDSKKEDSLLFFILVVVVVKPAVPFPYIEGCGNNTRTCFAQVYLPSIQCSVRDARPNVTLSWMARMVDGDTDIPYDTSFFSGGLTSTFFATSSDIFHYSPVLVLLVCKASSPPGVLENNESLILTQNGNFDVSKVKAVSKYIERNTQMVLNCTEKDVGFVVWKKTVQPKESSYELLLYSILVGENMTKTFVENAHLESSQSLVVSRVNVNDEGIYFCLFGDGVNDGVSVHDVTVIVQPSPPYLAVNGCNLGQSCALEVGYEGSLTCSVTAIRPRVELTWRTFYDRDTASISFTNQQLLEKDNGDTFDVELTALFHVKDESRDQVTVECTLVEPYGTVFDLKTKVDLFFESGTTTEVVNVAQQPSVVLLVTVGVVLLILTFSTLAAIMLKRKRNRRKSSRQRDVAKEDEIMPMVSTKRKGDAESSKQPDLKERKETLIGQLRERYKDLYGAVTPIPFLKDRLYSVANIFVEGGIEYLHTEEVPKSQWKKLQSYTDVFDRQRIEFTRLIIEGEPGYGKSTMTLQLAYDWCNRKHSSHMKDIDILILLRLRQLRHVSSIFMAIKYLLLPHDSHLKEGDIEEVFSHTESVVIILDGYDEYPGQAMPSDIMKIIERNMFQKCQVIITTRPYCLPKKLSPQTKRVRLKGFDDTAQAKYISKTLGPRDEERIRNVKDRLQGSSVLSGLCQVPLFFVMYVHMMDESDTHLNFNSVTNFFQHMVSCFHEHMRNKMSDEYTTEYELYENDHQKLDKVAFEALGGTDSQLVWQKESIRERLGKSFYDAYLRVGILVEEEISRFVEQPSNRPVQRYIEVRFYHKLFCEWYAAHFLSRYASKTISLRLGHIIKKRNPFDLQYLYRFACGLKPSASGKIITHIKKLEGGEKFAILCIMEQTGSIEHVKEPIRQLCAKGVIIRDDDSLLLQMSSLQLLEIAANNNIPITLVRLHNCLDSVDLSTESVKLKSHLELSSRTPIERLQISLPTTEISEDKAKSILEFSSKSPSLKALWYLGWDTVPQPFEINSTLSALKSRNVEVYWRSTGDKATNVLDLQSGTWEKTTNDVHQQKESLIIS